MATYKRRRSHRTRRRTMSGGTCATCGIMRGGRRTRRQRGGDGAADWAVDNFGSGPQQFQNTFGPGSNPLTGGILQPLPGASAVTPYNSGGMSATGPAALQSGGRRRGRKGTKRGRKGGMWGSVISDAVVPFGLIALNDRYGKHIKRRKSYRY